MKLSMSKINTYSSVLGVALVAFTMLLQSCTTDPNSPGIEYMPDMYRSPSYETYGKYDVFPDSMSAQLPVAGTMSQGEWPYQGSLINALPFEYENNIEGYTASAELKNPIDSSEAVVAEGKRLYDLMCVQCHGEKGAGDGQLVKIEKYPPPPAYNGALKTLEEGKMFHSIHYGKNLMPSHASQLSKEERWKIIRYIQKLQQS